LQSVENVWGCGGVVKKGMKVSRLSGAESVMGKHGKLEVYAL